MIDFYIYWMFQEYFRLNKLMKQFEQLKFHWNSFGLYLKNDEPIFFADEYRQLWKIFFHGYLGYLYQTHCTILNILSLIFFFSIL